MPKSSYSAKQRKLAAVAPPRDKITGADLKKLKSKKKNTHTRKHMEEMRKLMLKGKTFTEAHTMTMKKVGK